ncbi:hypothetical protein L1987_15124 [Smallanthus sonchifolius]|uniref:Uncharacterized protein n=1 Tax=Smallanthus sonchifolius TaxID=185202 RepID=A0ACB9J6W2_9ASTR|nr:hypothetical protein L1987_15124 [Smallanthus sonchifolius]
MNRLKFDARHNICACLTLITRKSRGYEETVWFLNKSRILTAISTQVTVYESQIQEFWNNVEYKHVNKEIWIERTVGGNKIKDNEQVIVQVTKTLLGKQWRYLVHVFIHCLGPRTGAFDQIDEVFSRALAEQQILAISEVLTNDHKHSTARFTEGWKNPDPDFGVEAILVTSTLKIVFTYNLGNLLNYDNEIGTSQKPPKLLNVNDYSNWKACFEHYISYTDSSLWIPILEGYKHPTYTYLDEEVPKPISKLDEEENKVYDREKKAHKYITMALTRELFHSFRGYDNSKDL